MVRWLAASVFAVMVAPSSAFACGMYYEEPIALTDVFDSIDSPQLSAEQREEYSLSNVARIAQEEKVRSELETAVATAPQDEADML